MIVVGFDVGVRDLGSCVLRYHDEDTTKPFEVLDWRVTDLCEWQPTDQAAKRARGAWHLRIEDVVTALVRFVNDFVNTTLAPFPREVVTCVIERQFLNLRMVSVSHALQCALESHAYHRVVFVPSMSRFDVKRFYTFDDPIRLEVKERSLHYASSLLLQTNQLERDTQMRTAIAHKRDDLSDALLLGLSYACNQIRPAEVPAQPEPKPKQKSKPRATRKRKTT